MRTRAQIALQQLELRLTTPGAVCPPPTPIPTRQTKAQQQAVARANRAMAAEMAAQLVPGLPLPKAGKRGEPKSTPLDKAVSEAERRGKHGEWRGANGRVFVGLYAHLHHEVYGVQPAELSNARILAEASKLAMRTLTNEFGGDEVGLVGFMSWSWQREARFAKRAAETHRELYRMTWRTQFSPQKITDYRVHVQQQKKSGGELACGRFTRVGPGGVTREPGNEYKIAEDWL